jgi:membrane-associated phospholipid phosphatase
MIYSLSNDFLGTGTKWTKWTAWTAWTCVLRYSLWSMLNAITVEELARFVATHAVVLLLALVALLGLVPVVIMLFRRLRPGNQVRRSLPRRGCLLVHLGTGLLVSMAILVFVFLSRMIAGETAVARFDLALARMLYDSTTPLGRTIFSMVTHTGSFFAHAIIGVLVGVALARRREKTLLIGWAVGLGGIQLLISLLKFIFKRARPDVGSPIILYDWSFPSGHALSTVVVSGLVAYFVLRLVPSNSARTAAPVLALAWTLMVAFSRMYLGVHYFSDVVAGFAAGAVWLGVCISGLEASKRRSAKAVSQR